MQSNGFTTCMYFSFFALYSLLLLSFFLYLKSVPIHVIVHVHVYPPPTLLRTGHSKLQAQFQSMEVRNSCFAAFIDFFTPNTYVMVIMSDPTIRESTPNASIQLHIHIHNIISTCTMYIYISDAVHFISWGAERNQCIYMYIAIYMYMYVCI